MKIWVPETTPFSSGILHIFYYKPVDGSISTHRYSNAITIQELYNNSNMTEVKDAVVLFRFLFSFRFIFFFISFRFLFSFRFVFFFRFVSIHFVFFLIVWNDGIGFLGPEGSQLPFSQVLMDNDKAHLVGCSCFFSFCFLFFCFVSFGILFGSSC